MNFEEEIVKFVERYSKDGWILKETPYCKYATLERRIIECSLNDEMVFATYYIDVDEVFKVPVLSVALFLESGHRLTHQEYSSLAQKYSGSWESNSKYLESLESFGDGFGYGAISEREHPITGLPVLFIHPCRTKEFITPLIQDGFDFMHIWMARYGPLFFYKLPIYN